MTLTCRNIKSLKYISFNVIYTHALTKLNCISDLNLRKSEIMPLTLTIFIVRRLQSRIYCCFIYCLVVECGIKFLQLQKNFMYLCGIFFVLHACIPFTICILHRMYSMYSLSCVSTIYTTPPCIYFNSTIYKFNHIYMGIGIVNCCQATNIIWGLVLSKLSSH